MPPNLGDRRRAELAEFVCSKVVNQAGVDQDGRPIVVCCASYLPDPADMDYDELLRCGSVPTTAVLGKPVASQAIRNAGSERSVTVCRLTNIATTPGDMGRLILAKLSPFVESDYTVILFSAEAQHRPTWSWLLKAYLYLDRKYGFMQDCIPAGARGISSAKTLIRPRYKKNLKVMYIVHPTIWARVMLNVLSAVISPKFFRKIQYCNTLSQLASLVPLAQVEIPPKVYTYNRQLEAQIASADPSSPAPRVFGVPAADLMGTNGDTSPPKIVRDCTAYIRSEGLSTEGIFRRSPSSVNLREAKACYERGENVELEDYGVHVAAVLLKTFFRELPRPVFAQEQYASLMTLQSILASGGVENEQTAVEYMKSTLLPAIPAPERTLFREIMSLLRDVSIESRVNLMTASNLAICWAPNLARSSNPLEDIHVAAGAVTAVIRLSCGHFDEIFMDDFGLSPGAKPRPASSTASTDKSDRGKTSTEDPASS